jgi:hypothetical protein
MSEATTESQTLSTPPAAEKTETEKAAAPAAPVKPKEPVVPAFSTDVLQTSTARFTRKAWDLYLVYKKDMEKIRTVFIWATITTRSIEGAKQLRKTLEEQGQSGFKIKDNTLELQTTFETIQTFIKHPEIHQVDARPF